MRPRSGPDLDEAFDALIRLGPREGRQQMLTHARLFLKTHPRSSGQGVLEMLEDGCDRFWVPGMQIDSKTTIAGVPIIKVRDALRRSDACSTPRSSISGSGSPRAQGRAGKGRGRPERLTIDGRVVLSPDIDGNERYELATDGHALAGATARQPRARRITCLLYTSDAADEEDSVDLGGRRIIKK